MQENHHSISSFYDGTSIFITGGTGFLGKAIIEKLLRSCWGLERIYVLMRPTKRENLQQRFESFQRQVVFDRSRHPNTYTLTKLLAERLVAEFNDKLPLCIVRPSIVLSAVSQSTMSDPFPGWKDNIHGVTGLFSGIACGMIRSVECDRNLVCDLIPVDIVSNTIIAAAWSIHKEHRPEGPIKVFNCVSGNINPITWGSFETIFVKWARMNPTSKVIAYPNFTFRKSKIMHYMTVFLVDYFLALILDLLAGAQGKPKTMFKTVQKINSFTSLSVYFTTNKFAFEVRNMKELSRQVKASSDGGLFNCNVMNLDWNSYLRDYMHGIRKFILRDEDSTMESARKKVAGLYWVEFFLKVAVLLGTLYGMWTQVS